MTDIIALNRVSFVYAGPRGETARPLFQDASLTLRAGEQIGLYGPNGSGKTTLFRLLAGLETPQCGEVLFHGVPVAGEKAFRPVRRSVGLVLQHAEDQLFCATVLEDVAFGPLNMGLSPEAAEARALETLHALHLDGFEQRLTHRLSGGEQRLAALATVLAMRPEALLLDEPTSGLDPQAREHLIHVLRTLPTARIIISHDWDFLAATSNRFLTIADRHLFDVMPALPHSHIHMHPLGDHPHAHTD